MKDFKDLMMPNFPRVETKGWGVAEMASPVAPRIGEIYAWYPPDEKSQHKLKAETVKILYFDKNKKLSLHFHKDKEEIFICAYGKIKVEIIDKFGTKFENVLAVGERIFIPKCTPHRMTGLDDVNILVEVSTLHKDEDSYRIVKGD